VTSWGVTSDELLLKRGGELDKIEHLLSKNIEEIIERKSIEKKLRSGKKLTIKYGADPSAPDLHLGHSIGLKKLKEFQDLGHNVVFIVGDFTGMIGDPSGRSKTRPALSAQEVKKNAKTYFEQVGKILDIKKTQIVFNSEWFNKMTLEELIRIAGKFTAARILERDDFAKRYKEGSPIGLHELLYPVLQAYDSVKIEADVEIGGSDQRFNMLAGRQLMKDFGLPAQDIIILPLLVGTDGKNKMSKSLGNYIGVAEPADEMFGKLMSIPDELIVSYLKFLTDLSDEEIAKIENQMKNQSLNPRDAKEILAKLVVSDYWGEKFAERAALEFRRVFSQKEMPEKIPVVFYEKKPATPLEVIASSGVPYSKSQGRRIIEQGGLYIENQRYTDPDQKIELPDEFIVKIGKRIYKKLKRKLR
jgi:tyrosyl-tRNA synthetase